MGIHLFVHCFCLFVSRLQKYYGLDLPPPPLVTPEKTNKNKSKDGFGQLRSHKIFWNTIGMQTDNPNFPVYFLERLDRGTCSPSALVVII